MEELFYKGAKIEIDGADIVTRLRSPQKWSEVALIEGATTPLDLYSEAADEIERLRDLIGRERIACAAVAEEQSCPCSDDDQPSCGEIIADEIRKRPIVTY